jgi:1-acyl-sn-glycerol-3-phosphate acyltransferase
MPAPEIAADGGTPAPEQRQEWQAELDEALKRMQAEAPEYTPPPFSPRALIELLQKNLGKLPPGLRLGVLQRLRESLGGDMFDVDTWKGIWTMLNFTLEYQGDMLKRRMTGEYQTDEWGLDSEVVNTVRPLIEFMYKNYWRVETTGLENVPAEGRACWCQSLGQLPWEGHGRRGAQTSASGRAHALRRVVPHPALASDLLTKLGQVLATEDNGTRLLEQDQLVAVYPEGYKGVGKLFRDRYRLARFGRGGFVRMALKTRAPLIPVAVVGAEETYISLHKSALLARLTGFPYFPISPTFPWLGLAGMIPLPTKWYIDFGTPISTADYRRCGRRSALVSPDR